MPSERFQDYSDSDSEETSTQQVLDSLGFRKQGHDEEYHCRISAVGSTPATTQAHLCTAIANEPKYQDWYRAKASAVLLICAGRSNIMTDTMLFSWSRKLVTDLKDKEEANRRICIYYFCLSSSDKPGGTPKIMIASLLGQLLCQHEARGGDLQYVHYDLAKLKDHDLETLCSTFETLVKRLPPTVTLHCVIDNISAFETVQYQAHMVKVISKLARIADNAVYKLLLTHANTSQYEKEYCLVKKSSVLFLEGIMSDDDD